MAEDSDQERSEEPTSRRLDEAREKGQIARSKEWNTLAMLLIAVATMMVFGDYLAQALRETMIADFRLTRRDLFEIEALHTHLLDDAWRLLKLLAPFLFVMVLVAVAAPMAWGGWNFSPDSFMPNWEKLDPLKGLARMFSPQALTELIKALLKFVLIGGVTAYLFKRDLNDMLELSRQSLEPATQQSLSLLLHALLLLCASLVVIAVIDVPFQLWQWKRQLRMTKQEVRDEMRDVDGKPEVKNRIRSLQMEFARRRMMEEVPKADVVVTNPTHYAVALRYVQSRQSAPIVVAKGTDLIAGQIRTLAEQAGVPILPAPPLARALYASTALDHEIPPALYLAVAQVLAYVYQLKAAKAGQGDIPLAPDNLQVPEEFLH